ncbi:MAG: hypothetical protein IKZ86_02320, partial [Spirochaetaceae bacterium]|nr:hypothetical protein [Spirochaetaceae bacterium]
IFVLLLIYFVLLFWNKKSNRACIVRIAISIIVILAAIILPFVFHYPYSTMSVWYPLTAIIAVIAAVCTAVFDLYRAFTRLKMM